MESISGVHTALSITSIGGGFAAPGIRNVEHGGLVTISGRSPRLLLCIHHCVSYFGAAVYLPLCIRHCVSPAVYPPLCICHCVYCVVYPLLYLLLFIYHCVYAAVYLPLCIRHCVYCAVYLEYDCAWNIVANEVIRTQQQLPRNSNESILDDILPLLIMITLVLAMFILHILLKLKYSQPGYNERQKSTGMARIRNEKELISNNEVAKSRLVTLFGLDCNICGL